MSLDLTDLGLANDVTNIVTSLCSGYITIVKKPSFDDTNPYSLEAVKPSPDIVHTLGFISYKDGSTRNMGEIGEDTFGKHSVTVGKPIPFPTTGDYAYINFSRGTKIIVGIIESAQISVSSLVKIVVKENDSPIYTWDEIKDNIILPDNVLGKINLTYSVPPIDTVVPITDQVITSSVTDSDGVVDVIFTFTWETSPDSIPESVWTTVGTSDSLSLTPEMANQYLRLKVSYIDNRGSKEDLSVTLTLGAL